jgi:hypothetical protein
LYNDALPTQLKHDTNFATTWAHEFSKIVIAKLKKSHSKIYAARMKEVIIKFTFWAKNRALQQRIIKESTNLGANLMQFTVVCGTGLR